MIDNEHERAAEAHAAAQTDASHPATVPLKSVNAMSVTYAAHLVGAAKADFGQFQAHGYSRDDARAVVLRGHLTTYACLSTGLGLTADELAAALEAFAGRVRSGESKANAAAWLAEARAFEAAHPVATDADG